MDGTLSWYTSPWSEWNWERWQWRGTLHSRKLQHYCNLTIKKFCVIIKTLVWWVGSYPLQRSSRCILQPQPTGQDFSKYRLNTMICIFIITEFHIIQSWGLVAKSINTNTHPQRGAHIYIYIYIERERERDGVYYKSDFLALCKFFATVLAVNFFYWRQSDSKFPEV